MTKDEALKLALEALEDSIDLVRHDYETDWRHGMPTRKAQLDGKKAAVEDHEQAINAIKEALAQPAKTFSPDWDAMAVMVEEQQRMAKRIKELEQRYEFKIYGKAWATDGEHVYVDGVRKEPPKPVNWVDHEPT